MFRLSCLQHILMWIYWWMRRTFLIKSTVQSKTPISFDDEVLKLLIAQSRSSVPCAALQMFLFGSSVAWLLWLLCARHWQAVAWPILDLSHSPWVWPCSCFQHHSGQIPLNKTSLLCQAVLWDSVLLRQVGDWLMMCTDDPGKSTDPQMAALLSVTPGNRITVPAGKEKWEIQQHKQEWKQQGQGNARTSRVK